MIKKNLTRGLQFACGVAVVAAAVGATMHTNETIAAASAPSGQCGLLLTANTAGYVGKYNSNFQDATLSLSGVLNFDTQAASLTAMNVQNYNQTGAYNTGENVTGSVVSEQSTTNSGSGYIVTLTVANQTPGQFLFVPTNGNKTFLVTTYKDPNSTSQNGNLIQSGVCQAL